jgi:hypothetical protein
LTKYNFAEQEVEQVFSKSALSEKPLTSALYPKIKENIMYSIFLVVEKPKEPSLLQFYGNTVGHLLELSKQNTGIQALGENVALFQLEDSLNALSAIIHKMDDRISYKYTIFDQEIEWHEGPKKV